MGRAGARDQFDAALGQSSRMAWPAVSPKIRSGSRSGVTSVTVASRTLRVAVAAMMASS